ncbi:hypothetical protein PACTADRAFT_64842 [Pachysolen tannophilus NRRL Y-2460]|uniref:Major facilitator superfamily (MFS) profile domain-containing protein n=1 Tax=Pachysolen tannophilus NRRL Y-2460 TaxID=669874 RepID=A0A1E4TXP4_PACTA|nr:hypothetical protein PACTADRAFT_64842 [Pachysolen tannophilus NRRL Y-2460]
MGIDYDAIPGTTHLVDLDLSSKVEHAEGKKEIVLIPTPSEDPNDPLNWSKGRKWMHVFCIILYTFGVGVPGTCIYSILTDISEAPGVDISVTDLNDGTGYMFLFLGIGCLFFQPIALQYGKRPVYLLSTIAVAMFNLWQPYITTNGQWIASKILAGFFAAPIEALPEISISDLFFEHERATYMGIYAVALFGSNYIAPLVAGFINENSRNLAVGGWKWVIYWSVIFCCMSFVFLFFFMEETNYERKLSVQKDSDGNVLSSTETNGDVKSPTVVTNVTSHQTLDELEMEVNEHLENQAILVDEPIEYAPPKNFWQKLSLTSGIHSKFLLWEYMKGPFYMLQFPVVLWSGFLYGSSLFWYSVLNGTESLVLSAAPYNFSSSMCGLAYVSPVIFVLIIYFYAGWTTDWLKIKFAKRRNGLSHAEDRLWALVVYMILGPFALILWGVGAYHGIHWFGVVFGLGLMAGLCIIGCVNAVTYVIDCYHELSCEAMATVVMIRNTMNFAMDYGITPWVDNTGLQNTFVAAAFICLFCISTFFVMELTGLYWRKKTKDRYWKLIERRRRLLGVQH